jgi:hypothetical protein
VLHFKHDTFARRKALHRNGDTRLDLFPEEAALGVLRRTVLALALKEIGNAFLVVAGVELGSLVLGTRLAAA